MAPPHGSFQLEASFNGIVSYGMLHEIANFHLDVPPMDWKNIEKEIVMYMIKYNVPHCDIIEKVPKSIA